MAEPVVGMHRAPRKDPALVRDRIGGLSEPMLGKVRGGPPIRRA